LVFVSSPSYPHKGKTGEYRGLVLLALKMVVFTDL
jgi:hypothetical protein